MQPAEEFNKRIQHISENREQRVAVQTHQQRYAEALLLARKQYTNEDLAKDRAAYLKWKVTENLDKYLIDFEATLIRKGGKVLWAHDADAALAELSQIMKKQDAKLVFKGKSMLSEELDLNTFLRSKGIDVVETDIGEYIVDEAKERPFHMVNPAMHKTEKEIAALLNTGIGTSLDADAESITAEIRDHMRKRFKDLHIDVCITGANFLIADSGLVALTENEGNIRMSTAMAKVHVVLAGIDKIIPSLNDIDVFFPLLATYGTGQRLTAYNSVIGPRTTDDPDGASEFIVILVDNGRTNLLAQADQRQALSCIKCGACANVCPVFTNIGGHTYAIHNSGPVGSVTQPYLKGMDEYKHLSFASPICGNCSQICPVKIDLHNHLLRNRRDSVQQGYAKSAEKLIWYSWKKMMLNRKNMNKGATIKNFMLKSFFKTLWGEKREFPKVADKSFNQLWREK